MELYGFNIRQNTELKMYYKFKIQILYNRMTILDLPL